MSISKKDQIAYWSSEEFLNRYFQKLKFDEPYAKGEYQKWHKFAAFKWWHKCIAHGNTWQESEV